MLKPARRLAGGFSIIELMVVVTLISFLLVLAVPAFGRWSADGHVRAAAESLVNAIRATQAAGIGQGRTSVFALTSDTPPVLTSTPVQNGKNWFSQLNILAGSDETQARLGFILKSTEGTQHAVAINGPALTCFNSVGRQVSLTPTATSLAAASCTAADPTIYTISRPSGASRQFKVLVYLGGRVRMCDAAKTLSSTNPDGCP